MIYSRFGSEFRIVGGNMDTGYLNARRMSDNKLFENIHIMEYKADGGIQEIEAAVKAANKKIDTPTNLSEIGF